MGAVNKWIRIIHRWLSIGLMSAVIIAIVMTIQKGEDFVSPGWLNILGIGSLLSMLVTGVYLFLLHYISKLRRAIRVKKRARPAPETTGEAAS